MRMNYEMLIVAKERRPFLKFKLYSYNLPYYATLEPAISDTLTQHHKLALHARSSMSQKQSIRFHLLTYNPGLNQILTAEQQAARTTSTSGIHEKSTWKSARISWVQAWQQHEHIEIVGKRNGK